MNTINIQHTSHFITKSLSNTMLENKESWAYFETTYAQAYTDGIEN